MVNGSDGDAGVLDAERIQYTLRAGADRIAVERSDPGFELYLHAAFVGQLDLDVQVGAYVVSRRACGAVSRTP
jgi:hypothetical protein